MMSLAIALYVLGFLFSAVMLPIVEVMMTGVLTKKIMVVKFIESLLWPLYIIVLIFFVTYYLFDNG